MEDNVGMPSSIEMLENPIWHSLISGHSRWAIGNDLARRHPADVAPFVGVGAGTPEAEAVLQQLVSPGEKVGIAGIAPTFGSGWQVDQEGEIQQMVFRSSTEVSNFEPDVRVMTEADFPAMLDLAGLVYPAYFRPRTPELGEYLGLFEGDRLCAMAGERFAMPGHREISGVITHPDFQGRGYASRLVRHLTARIQAKGELPFLHTEHDNERALAVYERLGFERSRMVPVWMIVRQD
jgi:predicted GNAT family acetyltransferase